MFNYNFELVFYQIYDQAVVDASGSPDATNTDLQMQIKGVVRNIMDVLAVQPGIRQMSTFIDFNDLRYRITVYQNSQ
jgi:hypothetical protein